MRSKQLNLDVYNTDKITNRYLDWYDPMLEPWVGKEIKLLEVGVFKGGSLRLWRDYFTRAQVIGIDQKLPEGFGPEERIQIFQGSQADERFLSDVAAKTAPEGFDIVIDDASHIGELTSMTFWHLFDKHLKAGGLYVIEDWGTGYWDDWPDGKSLDSRNSLVSSVSTVKMPFPCHSYGMVGFVKQLVDEQCAADVTRGRLTGKATRASKFQNMLITPSIVFVRKATVERE